MVIATSKLPINWQLPRLRSIFTLRISWTSWVPTIGRMRSRLQFVAACFKSDRDPRVENYSPAAVDRDVPARPYMRYCLRMSLVAPAEGSLLRRYRQQLDRGSKHAFSLDFGDLRSEPWNSLARDGLGFLGAACTRASDTDLLPSWVVPTR